MRKSERGFTIIELLISTSLLIVLSGTFLSVMISGTKGSNVARSVVRISEEARLGFNRMIRDTREGDAISSANPTSFHVRVDFNGDGVYQNPNDFGDFEELEFSFDPGAKTISLNEELLIDGVMKIPNRDVFSYSSNYLEYDANGDGVSSWQELDDAVIEGVGNDNNILDGSELFYVSSVSFALRLSNDGKATDFFGEAQLRNRR